MKKHVIAMFVCSTLGSMGASGFALAETIGRYECSVIGVATQEPIDSQAGHFLADVEYSCFGVEGPLKGVVHTASSASEWTDTKGTFVFGGGIHRAVGGLAVTEITEGTGSIVMKDGKPIGTTSSGTGLFKFASGSLVRFAGKAFKFASKPIGLGRFEMDFTD